MTAAEEGDEEKKTTAMWTTWEELLLACAVKRHGFNDWDTVAVEIQTRTTPSLADSFTPKICRNKYHELKNRFGDETSAAADDGDATVPWIEELRKLRVAELTKDVQRYDRSIQSLQLKVKRLEGELEYNLKESGEKNEAGADLERSENDKIVADVVPASDTPANTERKEVSGEHSNRSFNESNSSEERDKTGGKRDSESEPIQTTTASGGNSLKPDPESKTTREDSCNDSSDTVAKYLVAKTCQVQKNSNEASESKEGAKESSDVQNSANLTKKKRKPGEVSRSGGSSSGGSAKVEPVEVFSATTSTTNLKREVVVKSDPLVVVMDIIRAHKHGSMFERRLESQKSDKYNKIVRQHVDLRMVQTRIDDGSYSSCTNKFFLDLLLIFNNAIVYFPKQSSESMAAKQLRLLVLKEMRKKQAHSKSPPDPPSKPDPAPIVTKPFPERPDSLLAKQKSAVPIVVCRKRSSISGKVQSSSNKAVVEKEKEKEPAATAVAKAIIIPKPPVRTSSNEDDDLLKMKMKEKPVTGVRSMRRSGNSSRSNSTNSVTLSKNQVTSTSTSLNLGNSTSKGLDSGGGAGHGGPAKVEKKKAAEVTPAVKKRGAADFLKRLKKNSPGKGTPAVEEDGGGGSSRKDQLKKKVEERRDGATARIKGSDDGGSGGGRHAKEDISPSKRSVGRPPKKGQEVVVPAKRGREIVEPESASKRPTKRSKR